MFISFFITSFLIVAAGTSIFSVNGQPEQKENHSESCLFPTGNISFPSILYHFFQGVDLTQLDPYLEGFTAKKAGMLFNLTCDRATKWIDGPVQYTIPDQIQTISTLSSTETLSTPVTCFQLSCYRQKLLRANVELDSNLKPVNGRGVMVSWSVAYNEAKKDLLWNHHAYGEIHSDRLKFSVIMAAAEDLRASCVVSENLRSLHRDYASNPEPYQEIIKKYGTHYFSSGTFGARNVELTHFTPDYFFTTQSTSLGNLTDSIRAHCQQNFDRLDPSYRQNSHVSKYWFGRFPPGPDKAGAYWPLAVSFKPITELLEQKHPAKAQLAAAIKVHMMKSALKDWQDSLWKIQSQDFYPISWGLMMGSFALEGLGERINEQLAAVVPDQAAVDSIGTLVETLENFVGLMNDHTPKN